ncbi:MAG: Txe/YoeB family addiction module toxin [Bacteroidales bacterium]|nr:Txe/YoeB family addiction module toxin [Bacteroidales bacterium]
MSYKVEFTREASLNVLALMKEDKAAYKKLLRLLEELAEHPTEGTGKPKPLRGDKSGAWSRRITDKHRLVYEIHGLEILVLVLSAYGHYDDKG